MMNLLLDHLWQSTLFALAVGLLTLLFRNNGAHVRYGLWFMASVKFLVPFSALVSLGGTVSKLFSSALPPPLLLENLHGAAQPFSRSDLIIGPAAASMDWPALLIAVWAVGFAAVATVWVTRWLRLCAILRDARDADIAAPMPVKVSSTLLEPGLVGIAHPVLLLPEGIAARLSPAEMKAVLAHEACHLRRRDNLTAAIHMLVTALFWFHPLLWWLGARLATERERACDEAVLASGNDPQTYAEGILKVCKHYIQSPLACAAGISGADLKQRMEDIMRNTVIARLNTPKKALLAATAAAALALPLLLGLPAARPAQAQVEQPYPGTEAAVRHQIANMEQKGAPDYSAMSPELAKAAQAQTKSAMAYMRKWGALRTITYRGKETGMDTYVASFANSKTIWHIGALQDGKISVMNFSPVVQRQGSGPSPGLEAAVRRLIKGVAAGDPPYDSMSSVLEAATRTQLPAMQKTFQSLGALRGLAFTGVDARGWDTYTATYANGTATLSAAPLQSGKLNGVLLTAVNIPGGQPYPGTEASLRRYIESLQRGQPNYDEMTPQMAKAVRNQSSVVLAIIKPWGALKAITFKGKGPQNMDDYEVTFEHGKAEWYMGPLTADGKVQRRGFHPL